MQSVAIDIGNTGIKYGIFEAGVLVKQAYFEDRETLPQELLTQPFEHAIVASVAGDAQQLKEKLAVTGSFVELSAQTALPFNSLYKTPETLGADRKAGVAGASYFFAGRNCLVIDAGTCITYDFLDSSGTYHGGGIAPGLAMKFKAVHTFTGRLPLVEREKNAIPLTGQTTRESIQSGVQAGTIAEIEGIIDAYAQKAGNLVVILCGGDAGFFESKLKHPIFVVPELVLIGLYRILISNV